MTSSIARMNCFLHGIEDFRIERGDTLAEPKLVQGDRLMRFDVVLANPPYSIKQWDRDAFASDPWGRNLYGTPPQGRADYAFWQHILQSLAPKTGRCAILFPHGVLSRQEEAARTLKDDRSRLDSAQRLAVEEVGALKSVLGETRASLDAELKQAREKLAKEETARTELAQEKSAVDRLAMAQAAEIKNLQDSFFALRGQLSKDAQLARGYLDEKERLENRIKELETKLKFQGGSDGLP
jgi:hypothetical protein